MLELLLPPPSEEILKGTDRSKVVCGLGGYPYKKDIESAGHEYQKFLLRKAGKGVQEKEEADASLSDEGAGKADDEVVVDEKKFLKLNYYEQLGIGKLGFNASENQIRQAYHKALIKYHPDKTGRGETDPIFLAVQHAYATLGDAQKRRAYDSQCDFDDWIPTGTETIRLSPEEEGEDFFTLYGPVFERNARFSTHKPVPLLGGDDTPVEEVYKFYDFWYKFESWRDFSHDAEHDVDSADYREEKRWMQRQNENAAKKKKKKEYQRLALLVDRAQAADPRIKRAKQQEKEAKERAKLEKKIAAERQRRAEEEAEEAKKRAAAEEEERKRAEARRAKEEREKLKRQQRAAARKIKELLKRAEDRVANKSPSEKPPGEKLGDDQVDMLCKGLEAVQLEELMQPFNAEKPRVQEGLALARKLLEEVRERTEREQAQDQPKVITTAAKVQEQKAVVVPWTEEETVMLTKCIAKFPGGTRNRWQQIADYINHHLGLRELKTKDDCIAKAQELQQQQARHALGARASSAASTSSRAAGKVKTGGPASAGPNLAAGDGAGDEDKWTAEQQSALEGALKKYPATLDKNERWRLIAEAVPGKTKKQCVQRYKELREAVLKQQQAK